MHVKGTFAWISNCGSFLSQKQVTWWTMLLSHMDIETVERTDIGDLSSEMNIEIATAEFAKGGSIAIGIHRPPQGDFDIFMERLGGVLD